MKKEMESMVNFAVFSEVPVETLSEHDLSHAISSHWVKTRKPDGTVRCKLVVRDFDHVVNDPDQLCEHSKPHNFEAFFPFRLHSGGMFQTKTFPQLFCMP